MGGGGWRCVDTFMDRWGWKGVSEDIFWVDGGGWTFFMGEWGWLGYILGGWGWVNIFMGKWGWVGVNGGIFWVGGGG